MNNDIIARGLVRLASTQSSAKTRATLLKVAQGLGFNKTASDSDDIKEAKIANLHLFAAVLNNSLGTTSGKSLKTSVGSFRQNQKGPDPDVRFMADENSFSGFFSKYGISIKDIASKQDTIRVHYWEHQAVPEILEASALKGYQANKASNYFKFFNTNSDTDLTNFNKEVTHSLFGVVGTVIEKLSAKFLDRIQADGKISPYLKPNQSGYMLLDPRVTKTVGDKEETVFVDFSTAVGPAVVEHLFKVIDNYITNNDMGSAVLDRQADRHAKAEEDFIDKVNAERTKNNLTKVKDLKDALQAPESEKVVVTLKDIKGNDLILNGPELLKNLSNSVVKKTSHSLPTSLQYLAVYSTLFKNNKNSYQNAAKKRITIAKSAMGCPIAVPDVDPPCSPKKADPTYFFGNGYGFDATGALKTFNSLNNGGLFDGITIVPVQVKVESLNRYLTAPFDMGVSRDQIKKMVLNILNELGQKFIGMFEDQALAVFNKITGAVGGSLKTKNDVVRLYEAALTVPQGYGLPTIKSLIDIFHNRMYEEVIKLRKPFDQAHNIMTDAKGTYTIDLTEIRHGQHSVSWLEILVKEGGLVAGGAFVSCPSRGPGRVMHM